MEKAWPKRPSDHQLQEAQKKKKKDSDVAITPVVEAVHIPAHLVPPVTLQAKQLYHIYTTLTGAELPQAKKP